MSRWIRATLKRSRAALILIMLARNARTAIAGRLRRGPQRDRMGARHAGFTLEESLDYLEWVVGDYERYGGLDSQGLSGTRVLELGPGDNLGVALCLLGKGAERVVCLDRFVTGRDPAQQRQINLAVAARMSESERVRLEGVLDAEGSIVSAQRRLVLIEGVPIESAGPELAPGSFELVISRAVLEHIYDLDQAFDAMDRLLVPGGRMAHKVDLSDHDLFSEGGQNPLTFLSIPDWIYDRMSRNTGYSNRHLIDYYREKRAAMAYEGDLLVSNVVGHEGDLDPHLPPGEVIDEVSAAAALVEQIRPRLLARFARLPQEDLAVSGIFLRLRKPD